MITDGKTWSTECHQLDCHVAAVPQTGYRGQDLKQHPCQKSSSVMRWLINAFSDPGAMVCSLFCGVARCGSQRSSLDGDSGASSNPQSTAGSPKEGSQPTRTSPSKTIKTRRRSSGLLLRSAASGRREAQGDPGKRATITTCANQETWRSRPARRLPRPDPNPRG